MPQDEYDPILKTGVPGLTIAKNEAKQEMYYLEKEYEKRIGDVCARVFCVNGTPEAVEEMRAVSKKQAVVIDADTLFIMIAKKCLPHVSNPRRYTVQASMIMRQELAKAYNRYCPNSEYPRVEQQFFDSVLGETDTEVIAGLVQIIRRMARLTASKPLAVTYAQEMAVRHAVDLQVIDEPLAIVVLGLTPEDVPEFDAGFFGGRPSEVIRLDRVKDFAAALAAAGKRLEKKMGKSEVETPAA